MIKTLILKNSIFYKNSANSFGGRICNFGRMFLNNSTTEKNYFPKNGGGTAVENNFNVVNCASESNIKEISIEISNSGNNLIEYCNLQIIMKLMEPWIQMHHLIYNSII